MRGTHGAAELQGCDVELMGFTTAFYTESSSGREEASMWDFRSSVEVTPGMPEYRLYR